MQRLVIILFFIGANSLAAQTSQDPPQCPKEGIPPLSTGLVEMGAGVAWQKCDMRCTGQLGPHHILLVGDSVGALMQANPAPDKVPLAEQFGGVKNKSWDYFMTNPAPVGMDSWKVLNTAMSGSAASYWWYQFVGPCIANQESPSAQLFRDTAPHRVWMEIGGNDIIYDNMRAVNPHWAHYVNNGILNNVGRMVAAFQRNGRTVLLMGYHSEKAANVARGDDGFPDLVERICGEDNAVINIIANDAVCTLANGIQHIVDESTRVMFDNLNKARVWLERQLGPAGELLTGSTLRDAPGISKVYAGLRRQDLALGRVLGKSQSLTGLFEDPAARFRGRHGNKMENYLDRFKGGVGWHEFWDFLQTTPRYEEGWAVQFAGANQVKAESAVITIYGRRLQESYWAQGVPIPGTTRRTVEYVSAEAAFHEPAVQWGSRNELMADKVHPTDDGYRIYGPIIAQKLKDLQYDTAPSDYDFTKNNWRDWTPLPEDPYGEDLGWLLLCFYFHICK